mgnify:CR=1 FL=1
MNTTPILRATNIVKKLGGKTILNDVSLDVHKGDVKVVIGPSGAGKSTFLQCLNYLLPPDSGDIWLEGKKVNARDTRELCALRQQVGMIFQDFNLIPILTAEENIIMPLLLDGKKPDKTKLRELAGFLGIENRLKHLPGELSGGQRQRVAIARALINDPVILLADEPTGNLDKKAADEIMELLLAVNRRGNTVLLVTHEQRYADLCGRKIEISDGRI